MERIAESGQLFDLAALEFLQAAIQLDGQVLAFVAVAHFHGWIGVHPTEAIHQLPQACAADHHVALGLLRRQAHQFPHRIGGQGRTTDAIKLPEGL